jgi:hypothetical protein
LGKELQVQSKTFYLPGEEVQSLLAGSGTDITARVIANMAVAQHGDVFSRMIAQELTRSSSRRDILLPEANKKWPGNDLFFALQLAIPATGWTGVSPLKPATAKIGL